MLPRQIQGPDTFQQDGGSELQSGVYAAAHRQLHFPARDVLFPLARDQERASKPYFNVDRSTFARGMEQDIAARVHIRDLILLQKLLAYIIRLHSRELNLTN